MTNLRYVTEKIRISILMYIVKIIFVRFVNCLIVNKNKVKNFSDNEDRPKFRYYLYFTIFKQSLIEERATNYTLVQNYILNTQIYFGLMAMSPIIRII